MTKFLTIAISLVLLALNITASFAETSGSKDFVARPKVGAAKLTLPSHLTWQASPGDNGTMHVTMALTVDAAILLRDIKALSAAALDKVKPCGDTLKVRDASAKLTSPTTLAYDLAFHFAKKICVTGGPSLDLPADVECKSVIAVSGAGSQINVDIRGAGSEPCAIDGAKGGIANFAAKKVFKRHTLELADQLPPEFQGAAVNVKTIAFDTPPSSPHLRITGETTMTGEQFRAFTERVSSMSRSTNR